MIRTLAILTTLAAIAGPVSAAERAGIRVNLVGKDQAAIHADIKRAAKAVCREANGYGPLSAYTASQCVADTIKTTEAQIADVIAAAPKGAEKLASAR